MSTAAQREARWEVAEEARRALLQMIANLGGDRAAQAQIEAAICVLEECDEADVDEHGAVWVDRCEGYWLCDSSLAVLVADLKLAGWR